MNPTPTNEPAPVSLSYPDKLSQEEIIVPEVNFQATNIADAVEYLSWQARRYDHEEKCDYRRGVPICYAVPDSMAQSLRVTMTFKDCDLLAALRAVADASGLALFVNQSGAVIYQPAPETIEELQQAQEPATALGQDAPVL